MNGSRRVLVFVGMVLAVALVAAGCGGDDDKKTADTTRTTGGGALKGDVVVSGSSTVEPISASNGEKFSKQNPGVAVRVDGPGTGDGFKLFCQGQTDVSDASRPIKPEEKQACDQAGIGFVELKIGIDGLSVVTSAENDAVDCLDFKDLYALIGPESQGFTKWSDAKKLGRELGAGHVGSYPGTDLTITGPGEESGTFDSFVELALKKLAEGRGQEATTRPDYQSSGNDNVIIEGVEGSTTSLGWVGFSFADENKDKVKLLEVDGGNGCVAPTHATVADGTYPLSRPLFIYVNTAKAKANPAVAAFVDFYLSDAGLQTVTEVDSIALPAAQVEATRTAWDGMG